MVLVFLLCEIDTCKRGMMSIAQFVTTGSNVCIKGGRCFIATERRR